VDVCALARAGNATIAVIAAQLTIAPCKKDKGLLGNDHRKLRYLVRLTKPRAQVGEKAW